MSLVPALQVENAILIGLLIRTSFGVMSPTVNDGLLEVKVAAVSSERIVPSMAGMEVVVPLLLILSLKSTINPHCGVVLDVSPTQATGPAVVMTDTAGRSREAPIVLSRVRRSIV